jgi:hypothetical protein
MFDVTEMHMRQEFRGEVTRTIRDADALLKDGENERAAVMYARATAIAALAVITPER